MSELDLNAPATPPRLAARRRLSRARGTMLGLAVAIAIAGSVTYAIAAMSFTPPDWVVGSVPSATDLRDVASIDATSACAVGAGGTILRTVDGGATWSALVSEATSTLNAVDMLSSDMGWAVGESGAVVTSSDGTHWTALPSGVTTDLLGVDFADTIHGWAVGRGGTVIATTDGGSAWTTQAAGVSDATALRGVAFVDASTGYAWGDGGVVARTTDAGSNWTTETVAAVTLHAGAFVDAQTGWVAGSEGVIRKTVDGGASWTTQTVDTTATIFGITFMDADHGFLVGGESTSTPGVIAGTANGGDTWILQAPDAPGAYRAVRFADADHGWIVGDAGTVLRTVPRIPASEETAAASAPGLSAPIGVYARAMTSGEVLLGWTESSNATSPVTYRVSRSVDGGEYASLAIVPAASGPSLVDTSAPALETVAYTVSTIDPTGESSAGAPVTVLTKASPGSLQVRPPTMSCTGCHSAHSARQTEVHPGPDGRCFNCHESDIGERLAGEDAGTRHDLLSADKAAGSRLACANCHQAHISSESTPIVDPDDPSPSGGMPRVTDAFCLRCHDDALPTSAETTRWAPVPLGADGATVAGVDIKAAWAGDLHGSAETTADPRLRPEMGYAKGDVLACTTCHDPHGSTNRWTLLESLPSKDATRQANALLVSPVPGGGADLRLFCASCHSLTSHPAADLSQWPLDCTGCHSHGRGL